VEPRVLALVERVSIQMALSLSGEGPRVPRRGAMKGTTGTPSVSSLAQRRSARGAVHVGQAGPAHAPPLAPDAASHQPEPTAVRDYTGRVVGTARDPLTAADHALLGRLR
jgi:hypothetical protein